MPNLLRYGFIICGWFGCKVKQFFSFAPMKAVEFLKMASEMLKRMSVCDLQRDDYKHIDMYEEYVGMREKGHKVDYILAMLSERYGMSESTVKRIIRRFSREVN